MIRFFCCFSCVLSLFSLVAFAVEDPPLSVGLSSLESAKVEEVGEEGEEVFLDPEETPEISNVLEVISQWVKGRKSAPISVYGVASNPVAGGPYFEVASSIGNLKIYVPADYQYGSFSYFNGSNICSIRAATISGYAFRGSTLYQVRFTPFCDPQYRLYNSTNSYADFTITQVKSTNIQVLKSDTDLPLYPQTPVLLLLIFGLMGVLLLCLFIKRF